MTPGERPRSREASAEAPSLPPAERFEKAEREQELLDERLEDAGIILLARERLAEPAPAERLVTLEQLAHQFGREHLLSE